MRFGFVTAVQLGLGCLEEIYDVGGDVDFLMTLRDDIARDKSGRVYLDDFAAQHGVPLHKIRNINDPEAVEAIRESGLDWLFIIGWSQIARADVLEAPTRGCIGMHPTLLPKGRGRASIPWAIIKDLKETGVTMFQLDEGVDTGPILGQRVIPIARSETATTLYDKVSRAHRLLMRDEFTRLQRGKSQPVPQDESKATYWPARVPADGQLVPTMTLGAMDRLVRATTHPYPGAFVDQPDGTRLTVWAGAMNDAGSETGLPITATNGTYWAIDTAVRS